MCTRFVYNGIDKIVGFNFDIDLSVWDHTVITEENRFYIGIKMPDGLYHSFHGIPSKPICCFLALSVCSFCLPISF